MWYVATVSWFIMAMALGNSRYNNSVGKKAYGFNREGILWSFEHICWNLSIHHLWRGCSLTSSCLSTSCLYRINEWGTDLSRGDKGHPCLFALCRGLCLTHSKGPPQWTKGSQSVLILYMDLCITHIKGYLCLMHSQFYALMSMSTQACTSSGKRFSQGMSLLP